MTNDDRKGDNQGPPLGEEPGADAWVDQWITLFEDTSEAEPEPESEADSQAAPPSDTADETTTDAKLDDLQLGEGPEAPAVGEVPAVGEAPVLAEDPVAADDLTLDDDPALDDNPALDHDAAVAESAEVDEDPATDEDSSAADELSVDDEDPVDDELPVDDDVATIEAWQRAQERSRRQAKVRANQRAARQMRQLVPDRNSVQASLAPATIRHLDERNAPNRRIGWVAGGLVAVILALIGYLFLAPGDEPTPLQQTATAAPGVSLAPETPELGLTVGAEVAPASIQDLARSTVQVVGLDEDGVPQCAGSGIIVSTDGMILTNAHVVRSDVECRFTSLGIGVTVDSSSPPDLLYRAEVVLLRLGVDLAVLRVAGPLTTDNGAEWPRTFPAAPLGDSDTVELGDPIRILGYPVIGGDTITLTTGTVSGFTSQVGLGNRALIKTDATISAGNSGGLAIDEAGRVVGIPTKARASERGPAVDCRPVSDTNDDGLIDGDDACVSVGGFVNGIRPINLSLPLLAAAGIEDPEGGPPTDRPEPVPVDLSQVRLTNPRFSLGVTDEDLPERVVVTAVAGVPELCFFVDWEGIPPGASWDGAWYVDNEIQVGRFLFTGKIWEEQASGQHFWLCIPADDEEEGLPAGVYEIAMYLDRQVVFVESIELTAAPVDTVTTTWKNKTGRELCGLAVNPAAISRQVGLNELPEGRAILPEGEWVTELPIGSFVVEAYDCEGEPIANRLGGLEITESAVFEIQS